MLGHRNARPPAAGPRAVLPAMRHAVGSISRIAVVPGGSIASVEAFVLPHNGHPISHHTPRPCHPSMFRPGGQGETDGGATRPQGPEGSGSTASTRGVATAGWRSWQLVGSASALHHLHRMKMLHGISGSSAKLLGAAPRVSNAVNATARPGRRHPHALIQADVSCRHAAHSAARRRPRPPV